MGLGAEDGRLRLLRDVRYVGHVVVVPVVHEDRVGRGDVAVDHLRLDHQLGLRVRALGRERAGLEPGDPGIGQDDALPRPDLPRVRPEPGELHRLRSWVALADAASLVAALAVAAFAVAVSAVAVSAVAASPRAATPMTPVAPTAAAPVMIPLRLTFTLSPLAVPGPSVKASGVEHVEYALAHDPIAGTYRRRSAGSC